MPKNFEDARRRPLRKTKINNDIQRYVDEHSDYLLTGVGKSKFEHEKN